MSAATGRALRIGIGGFLHETNTFAPSPAGLRAFEEGGGWPGLCRGEFSGFMTVDREKLKSVPAEDLADMMRKDELECTFLHLASLRHFRGMLERFAPKKETIGAEAERELQREGQLSDTGELPTSEAGDAQGGEPKPALEMNGASA